MNNLGDTSFNKRNLLKQGLGVNLYPLPFAKGGMLPKAQDGQKLSGRAKRVAERRSEYDPATLRKADFIAGQEMRKPWLKRQLEREPTMAGQVLKHFDPTGLGSIRPVYKDYKKRLASGDTKGQALFGAIGTKGLQALPVVGSGLWSEMLTNPATIAKIPTLAGKASDIFTKGAGSAVGAGLNIAARVGGTGAEVLPAIAEAVSMDKGDRPSFLPHKRSVPWQLVRDKRWALRQQSNKKEQGGSMPEYQMGGEMDMMSNAPQDLSGMQYNIPSLGEMPSVRFGHLKPKAPSPTVRSSVMPAPTPVAPRVQNMSAGPRTIGGGYRYNAGFGQGRPASGSITRRPNVRTKFQ